MDVTCTHCASPLKRSPAHVKGRSFCDRECRKAFHRPTITCAGCGTGFSRDPKKPTNKYCSWDCFKSSRHVTIPCVVCGKDFDSYVSEDRKRTERGHVACCSRSCRNSYTSRFLGGDGTWTPGGRHNPKKPDYRWRKVRAAYLAMVGSWCEGCEGVQADHVHHLHPRAAGGQLYDFDNLMAVCKDCHSNMHRELAAGAFRDSFEGVAFGAAVSSHA